MLTVRQNFIETLKGGQPDRFVDQYEYVEMIWDPIVMHCAGLCDPGGQATNLWGVTAIWPEGTPGPFPLTDDEHLLLKDVAKWKEIIKAPDPHGFSDEEWAPFIEQVNKIDRSDKFVSPWFINGIFEKLHFFMGMENCMVSFYTEPEAMHELIDFLADWEIECAKEEIKRYHPDMLYHHDDWGSQTRLFLSPKMFDEFLLPAYKKIYGFWKANGVEYIVHHSDCYAADLVPQMIEMGIDVFQGAVFENDIPTLLQKYGGRISIHGGLDNGKYDKSDWTKEAIYGALKELIEKTDGGKYLIPGFTMGGPGTTYPGAYEYADEAIAELSKLYFKK